MAEQIITKLRSLPTEVEGVLFDGTPERGGFIVGWITAQGGEAEHVGAGWEHRLRRDDESDPSNGNFYEDRAHAFVAVKVGADWQRVERQDWVIRDGDGAFEPWSAAEVKESFEVLSGARTLKVHFVMEAVVCERCETYFGVPLSFDNKPTICPLGHPNSPRKFEQETN